MRAGIILRAQRVDAVGSRPLKRDVRRRMSPSILLALTSALALQPDNAVFPQGLTCPDAADAEVQYGSQPLGSLDRTVALYGPFAFKRTFRGIPSSIVYLCRSDRRVQSRLIYLQFSSQDAATTAFDTYTGDFTLQFGAPCTPPKSESIPKGQGDTARAGNGTLEIRSVEWTARQGAITRLTLLPIGQAQLLVETIELSVKKPSASQPNNAVNGHAHETGSCGQGEQQPLTPPSNYRLERP